MADWKDKLSELYKVHRDQQKNTKGINLNLKQLLVIKTKKVFLILALH